MNELHGINICDINMFKYVFNLGQVYFCDGFKATKLWIYYEYIFGEDLFFC